jgi:ribonuclease T2
MMRAASGLCGLVALAIAAGCTDDYTHSPNKSDGDVPRGSGFDYYVLALSWSPGYCRSLGDRANREQCGGDPDHGFTVHGLWPNFHRGYPEYCGGDTSSRVAPNIADDIKDIMPSTGLINHEWKKHGTCSGLDQDGYFTVTRLAYDTIIVPPAFRDRNQVETVDPDTVEAAFREANPAIPADAIAVTCDRRFLRDVRICMSIGLDDFVPCPQVDQRSCRLDGVVVPPM